MNQNEYIRLDNLIADFHSNHQAMDAARQRGDELEALRLDAIAADQLDVLYDLFEMTTTDDIAKLGELLNHPNRVVVKEAHDALLRIDTPEARELVKRQTKLRDEAREAFKARKKASEG